MNSSLLKEKIKRHWNNNPMDYDLVSAKKYSKEYYDQINKQFRRVCYFGQTKNKPIFSKLINYTKLNKKQVLEVGCGSGTIARELAKQNVNLTAIDLTEEAIKNTKKQLKLENKKGTILVADAENLPFESESFDFVWSWGVIHHTPNTQKCIDEIYRVLKKGGQASIMIYHKNSLFYYFHLIFYRGFLQRRLFKKKVNLLNLFTDHGHKGGTPLAKAYSRKKSKKMFKKFNHSKFKIYGLKNELFVIPFLRKLCYKLPNSIPNLFLTNLRLGWYLFIKLKK